MQISDLKNKVHPRLFEILSQEPFQELRPCQEKALNSGLFEGKSLVVSSPTASGKTLVAEVAAINSILEGAGKSIYIVPLRSLASEKYREFKAKYEKLGLRVALAIGDLDSQDQWLANFDLIIATAEKFDSLIRHDAKWISQIKVAVFDEIHLLNDPGRGPVLEILITLLKMLLPNLQIIALSATIGNPRELATWLNAVLISDSWRPVRLFQGVFLEDEVDYFAERPSEYIAEKISDPALKIVADLLVKGKQALVFCPTKSIAESTAVKVASLIRTSQLPLESRKVLKALARPTKQCQKLAIVVDKGIAFHHAGLVHKQKELIEDLFREGRIKIICCTPTLCMHPNTEVWQNLNTTKVNEIKVGENIFALNNSSLELAKVREVNKTNMLKKLIELTSCAGYKIKTTPEHTFLVKRLNKRYELPASEIRYGDRLATVGKLLIQEKESSWKDFVKDNNLPFKNETLSSEIFYLIGAMLGDGYSGAEFSKNIIKYKGSPSIVGVDKEIFNKIKQAILPYIINFREIKNYYGTPQLILTKANWFREFLVRCGVDIGNRKYINQHLKSAPIERLAELLKGLFDTDGYVERSGKIGFSNSSLQLIKDVQQCLLRFGIVTYLRHRKGSVMKMHHKQYKTKDRYELMIFQKESISNFSLNINFGLERKKKVLTSLIKKFERNLLSVSCKKCRYVVHMNIFHGRTREQKQWAYDKVRIIKYLGEHGELSSKELTKLLGKIPRKKEVRLNLHYDLISKRRIGNRSKTEWFWKLNDIGNWIYKNIILENKQLKANFIQITSCPLCKEKLKKQLRNNWRKNDFEGDIFWDIVKDVKEINSEKGTNVYDIALDKPDEGFFVANGFLVHNSMGLNLPADVALMKSLKRFSGRFGSDWIPVLEYHQMTGRAGRPGKSLEGLAISLAKTIHEKKVIYDKFIMGEPEEIVSKLAVIPTLRTSLLSLIASDFVNSKEEMLNFFKGTFYGFQYGNDWSFEDKLSNILKTLESHNFVKTETEKIRPTLLGKRVSELYIDPETAFKIIKSIEKEQAASDFSFLQVISNSMEMEPLLNVRKSDLELVEENLVRYEPHLLQTLPREWDPEYEQFMRSFKTALLLNYWVEERSEEDMLETFGVRPGEVYSKIKNAEWLLYSASELARILKMKNRQSELNKTRFRVKHGIKEELVPLVRLRGIGRFRARVLYQNGFTNLGYLGKAQTNVIARALKSLKLAQSIKEQLNQKEDLETKNSLLSDDASAHAKATQEKLQHQA